MNNKILLNSKVGKKTTNVNNTINVKLGSNRKLLPNSAMSTNLNLFDQYNEERLNCNKIRLTCVINPICSNVLFNNVTEILKDEGSDKVISLNYTPQTNINGVVGKGSMRWTDYEGVRDTQISNDACGYQYHCGLNIFNNHWIRSKVFKTVCQLKTPAATFNTIEDYMRTVDGEKIKGYADITQADRLPSVDLHLYLHEDVLTFKQAAQSELKEENGWFGFINKGKMMTYLNEDKNIILDVHKPINSKKACDFIDMYPERDLFSFNPKYNHFRNRIEKNWNCCLTYPSSSTTENIAFIDKDSNFLKVIYFDENVRDYNGLESIVMYSVSKHGLVVGDFVNIYKDKTIAIRDAKVTNVTDDYIFSVFKNGNILSASWINLEEEVNKYNTGKRSFTLNTSRRALTEDGTPNIFYVVNNRVNVDTTATNIGYKKVTNGVENEYYVRIFSRLPNWRFCNKKPTEYEINKPNSTILNEYRKLDNDFQNTLSKMSYSKNAYSDDISQIVFTDDIDISNLKDNLGRPLTNIFITFIKNNKGYKDWYGKEGKAINIKTSNVEFSHCFGKVNCAFKLSDESLVNDTKYSNVTSINNIDNKSGMIIDNILRNPIGDNNEDEIDYYTDVHYYGDLSTYSPINCDEQSLQMIQHRFNTAQRELNDRDTSIANFNTFISDAEIQFDDYDDKPFQMRKEEIINVSKRKEGYCYIPHHNIPIKSFGINVQTQYPKFFTLSGFKKNGISNYELYTMENNYLELFDKFMLYDRIQNIYYTCIVQELINFKKLICKITDDKGLQANINIGAFRDYKVFKPDVTIPSYAKIATDGSCRYYWRELYQNGFDDESTNEIYPFTNDAIYINKMVNMYVRRQDPMNALKDYSINGGSMRSVLYPYDIDSNRVNIDAQDNYYNDLNITC